MPPRMRSEALTALLLKIQVFRDVNAVSLGISSCFIVASSSGSYSPRLLAAAGNSTVIHQIVRTTCPVTVSHFRRLTLL
jgi:hypothetical protein